MWAPGELCKRWFPVHPVSLVSEAGKKLHYSVQMLVLTQWLARVPPDDYGARLIARYVFVYLDMLVKAAPEVKNEHKSARSRELQGARRIAHRSIKKLTEDFKPYYARIRHEHTAHRKDSDLLDLIETWNAIDVTALDRFVRDACGVYSHLTDLDPTLPALTTPDDEAHSLLRERLSSLGSATADQPVVQIDTLASTRPNSLTLFPTHPLQRACFNIVSIIDAIHYLERLCGLVPAGSGSGDLIFLTRTMILLEVINLIDGLYPTQQPSHQGRLSLSELAKEANVGDHPSLQLAFQQRDVVSETKARIARNTIAAHIDPKETFETLQARLRDLTDVDLRAIWMPAAKAFDHWCRSDIDNREFLLHNRAIPDAIRVFGNEKLQKPFCDN